MTGKQDDPQDAWEAAGHEGSRRLQLRRARDLTLRERLQAVEQMSELSDRLRLAREREAKCPDDRE